MSVEQKYVQAFIVSSGQSNQRKQLIREWPQRYHEMPLLSSPPPPALISPPVIGPSTFKPPICGPVISLIGQKPSSFFPCFEFVLLRGFKA